MDLGLDDNPADVRSAGSTSEPVVVSTVTSVERREPVERLQEGLSQLVDQLEQINGHLSQQLVHHEELMGRVGQLPQILESLPSAVENQKKLTVQLLEHLRTSAARDRHFGEVVEKIPVAAARQTDALVDINHQLAAAAETDVQMAEGFNRFRATLDRLNQNTVSNTQGILQMSRTFAASDRYVKYVVTRLNKRYAWTLALTLSVCAAIVAVLVGVIFHLAN
jgi:chromosome segregation ATPase